MVWRRLQDILKISSERLQNIFKTSWRRIQIYSSWRRLEEVLWRRMTKVNAYVLIMKTSSEDKDVWRLQDVFKTYSSDVFMWCTIYKLKVLLLKKKHFHTKLPCQKPMLKQIKWKVQNERNKERSLATNYSLKVLTVFCETVFGFLEESANRDSKWFSDFRKPNGFTHTGNWTWFS